MLDIRGLFTKDAIIRYLKEMAILKTTVMDTVFTDRPQNPLPLVGVDLIQAVVQELPLIRRGAPSISAVSESGSVQFYEPLPVRPHKMVTGMDLNNLKILNPSAQAMWASEKTDFLRKACRKTTEAMCTVALSGTLTWPVKLEGGGYEDYQVVFGTPLSVTPGTVWGDAAAKLKDVFATLTAMEEAINEYGYGSELEVWAGRTAYETLFGLAESFVSTAKLTVTMGQEGIRVGGYLVKRMAEKYRHPQTGVMTDKLGAKVVRMIAKDAGHRLVYSAVDDLDANLLPMPFFVKPIKIGDPSGWKLVADSKPFPVPNVHGICDATVLT